MPNRIRIVAGGREAGDSLDFDIRHSRALRAQAMREAIEAVSDRYRAWRRRASADRDWQIEWPARPQIGPR